jgi:hypothetical protein
MQTNPDEVAARLGLDETTIARLRGHGQLERLALTQPEIGERLYRAHLAYLDAQRRHRRQRRDRTNVVGPRGRFSSPAPHETRRPSPLNRS